MIGLKRGTVELYDHEKEWEIEAQSTIERLRKILGATAKDIQHVGSTSIISIKAKPIIDIAVAVDNFDYILALESKMKSGGFWYRPKSELADQLLFASGSLYEGTGDMQTHFIHVVHTNSMEWKNYINFRNYLNNTPEAARAYEDLKVSLAAAAPIDAGREKYLAGKHEFIAYTLRKAMVYSYLGATVDIEIDRPVGTVHPKHDDVIYPINYGYIPEVFGGDGEELDVYVLGTDKPLQRCTVKIIAIVHRNDDEEDKLVGAIDDIVYSAEEIAGAINFQERFYDSYVEIQK